MIAPLPDLMRTSPTRTLTALRSFRTLSEMLTLLMESHTVASMTDGDRQMVKRLAELVDEFEKETGERS